MICFLSFFGCSNPAAPSTGTIQGQVMNVAGDTLIAGVNVSTTPTTIAVSTNAQGKYTINGVSRVKTRWRHPKQVIFLGTR